MTIKDITEDLPYDITSYVTSGSTTFDLTDAAYDVTIDSIPFIANVSNQNPYRRETAQYRKDQFDNSNEPGEQSLSGWWIRSQTSFHNGAGISFYEPGTDYQHVSHRFSDSRGVDIWTIGQASLLPEVFEAYTGNDGINAAVGNDGTTDCLVSGDSKGLLKKIILNGNSAATATNYTKVASSYPDGHSGTDHPFYSVTTDGRTYYAACDLCIHKGTVGTAASDAVFFKHSATGSPISNVFVKYAKGYIIVGRGRELAVLDTTAAATSGTHTSGAADSFSNKMTHISSNWTWLDASDGPNYVYVAGYSGNVSEIWAVGFDTTGTTVALDMPNAVVTATLPSGEIVNSIKYYLGYLAVGTNKGLRICPISTSGTVTLGPLLFETDVNISGDSVNAITERGTYLYAATKAYNESATYTHGILVRVDLSSPFDDGTFPYAYDLEYRSSVNIDNEVGWTAGSSNATEVYVLDNRLVMVIQESDSATKGELQVEHTTRVRETGWLKTGTIRYGTFEKKFFRYINVQCSTGSDDSIAISTIDENETLSTLTNVSSGNSNQDIYIGIPSAKQESMAFKFTLNNATTDSDLPILYGYQIKATPAMRRQRLIQYPLSCYDNEMDKYNSVFGYDGRAMATVSLLESLEETGKFVNIVDYRTGEQFDAIIEEVRFTNESSPDKNNSGFGGLLLVTVRKM